MDVDKSTNHSSAAEEKHYSGHGKMPWWLILLWVAFSAWTIIYLIRGLKG